MVHADLRQVFCVEVAITTDAFGSRWRAHEPKTGLSYMSGTIHGALAGLGLEFDKFGSSLLADKYGDTVEEQRLWAEMQAERTEAAT